MKSTARKDWVIDGESFDCRPHLRNGDLPDEAFDIVDALFAKEADQIRKRCQFQENFEEVYENTLIDGVEYCDGRSLDDEDVEAVRDEMVGDCWSRYATEESVTVVCGLKRLKLSSRNTVIV